MWIFSFLVVFCCDEAIANGGDYYVKEEGGRGVGTSLEIGVRLLKETIKFKCGSSFYRSLPGPS